MPATYTKEQMREYQRARRAKLRSEDILYDKSLVDPVYKKLLRGNKSAYRRYKMIKEDYDKRAFQY